LALIDHRSRRGMHHIALDHSRIDWPLSPIDCESTEVLRLQI